ncbi:putative Rab-GTPase-TBC domain-containing protein [Helianthus annuus]|nr:putative Rab-GTPase-TBC domain-containing protein [Helianthus annuus]
MQAVSSSSTAAALKSSLRFSFLVNAMALKKLIRKGIPPGLRPKDLPRTFPGHPWLDTPEGHAAVRRVLVGYSFRDSDVGYCQGLNYVAALLLLVMKTEEEAFWMLAVLLENVLVNDCYTDNLSGCHVDQRVFKDLLTKKCPRLSAHLDAIGFDVSLVATEWFLCLFSKSLPSEIKEEELLMTHHVGDAIKIIQNTTHHQFDPDDLLTVAFEKISFMTTNLSKQRKKQETVVMAELDQRLRRLKPSKLSVK